MDPYTKLQIGLQLVISIIIVLKDFKHGGKDCGVWYPTKVKGIVNIISLHKSLKLTHLYSNTLAQVASQFYSANGKHSNRYQ